MAGTFNLLSIRKRSIVTGQGAEIITLRAKILMEEGGLIAEDIKAIKEEDIDDSPPPL